MLRLDPEAQSLFRNQRQMLTAEEMALAEYRKWQLPLLVRYSKALLHCDRKQME